MAALMGNYSRIPLAIESAEGAYVTDEMGKQYLDFTSGIAVCNLGHRHPAVELAVTEQLKKVWHMSNLFENRLQETVAEAIVQHLEEGQVFFCNSGAEANEAAIKLARKKTGKTTIFTFQHSFHGRTVAAMTATAQAKIHDGFGPLPTGFTYLPYNDSAALKAAIEKDEDVAAVMLELIQGEGGVHVAEQSFIDEVIAICQAHNILVIVDEVQTGFGRTGQLFASQNYSFVPDIMTLAKGIANGIPAGALYAKTAVAQAFTPGSHGSTFGGNYLAMAASEAVINTITAEGFLAQVDATSINLVSELQLLTEKFPFFKTVRGQGLLIGIECDSAVADFITACRKEGLLVLSAGTNVLRLLPPLTITTVELNKAIAILTKVLKNKDTIEG